MTRNNLPLFIGMAGVTLAFALLWGLIAMAVTGFLFVTGRWSGDWLWPVVLASSILGLMIPIALRGRQLEDKAPARPRTWDRYIARKLVGGLFIALVYGGFLGLMGAPAVPYWMLYLGSFCLVVLGDGVEVVVKNIYRRIMGPKS